MTNIVAPTIMAAVYPSRTTGPPSRDSRLGIDLALGVGVDQLLDCALASSRPRPITMRWSAVRAISDIRWLATHHGAPLAGKTSQQLADPEDSFGVQTVDRLVEDQRPRVAQEEQQRCPPTVTRPEDGESSPMIILIVVDLPLQLGPRKPVTWPGSTPKDSWSSAAASP